MICIRENIPFKLLPSVNPSGNINLRLKKWLILGSSNPNIGPILKANSQLKNHATGIEPRTT